MTPTPARSSGEGDTTPQMHPDHQSHTARRRRTGKLSQFFGETIDLNKSPAELSSTLPRSNSLTRKGSSRRSILPTSPPSPGFGGGAGGKWKTRRETMDAVLGEMWRSVQDERGKGGMKLDEVDRLGDLMSVLRDRRDQRERMGSRRWGTQEESIWSNGIASTIWRLVGKENGSLPVTDWLCPAAFGMVKGDGDVVIQEHVEGTLEEFLPGDQGKVVFTVRDYQLQDPSNGSVIHEAYINRRTWAIIILFNISFVVKVTGADELRVSHIRMEVC
ncbi:hypothetical protein L198_06115 [Cryptococcus wingfieldii CBS 7118]|uniref:Uncharacterized protein n=1 Tax=Cryptococcus wingfieldii CBS 7118 TaxID=1295528 RepID=A0A1E3IQI7_9TREE|nr:hypothetical protein L198_06115 [Cryptococcus wingfieldii CBS 7118]ODN90798.1 hypothetical protein L198_06115 [Cryptococcus wingfieldii CBS 7118]